MTRAATLRSPIDLSMSNLIGGLGARGSRLGRPYSQHLAIAGCRMPRHRPDVARRASSGKRKLPGRQEATAEHCASLYSALHADTTMRGGGRERRGEGNIVS